MKKLIFVVIATAAILLPFSCKKNKELTIVIEGTIRNEGTLDAAQGVTVKIKYQEVGSGTISTAYKTIATTTTDANGHYQVSFTKPKASEFRYELSSPYHFSVETTESADNVSASTTNTRDFTVGAIGWFSVHIKNASPQTIQDQCIYQNTSEAYGCTGCCSNAAYTFQGTSVDTTVICQRKAGSKIKFNWIVFKGGNNLMYSDSALVVPFDTTVYNLNY